MCKSGLQIYNPKAYRLLDTSALSISAGILLREFDMQPSKAADYAERKQRMAGDPKMIADYAEAAGQLRAMVRP